jgi:hypothetical protein
MIDPPKLPPNKQLSEMTEEERRERMVTRFGWDSADIVWEPNPDDVEEPPLTPNIPQV